MTNTKIELEAILLKTILCSRNAFNNILGLIPGDFIFDRPEHRIIFKDIVEFFTRKGKAPDEADIYEMQLSSKDNREGIKKYLIESIARETPEIRDAVTLAKKIIEMKGEQELKVYQKENKDTGFDYVQNVSDKALEITNKYLAGCKNVKSNYEVAENVILRIMKGVGDNFIKTGFKKIDENTNGIPKNHLTVIAGRPGTGKTTFMLQLFRNLRKQNLRAGIFSLEMTADSLFIKNLSALSMIDSIKIENGNLTDSEKSFLLESSKQLTGKEYQVIDLSIQTPGTIKAQINLWKLRNEVDIVFLDYLTLVNTNYKQLRQDLEIGKLSAELNSIAKTTGLPIVILSQLNRQSEARTDKKPLLADLRESGSVEQDANLVMLLYRPALYGINGMNNDYQYFTEEGCRLSSEEYFEVIIAKARNGRTGNAVLRYRPEIHTFESVKIVKPEYGDNIDSEGFGSSAPVRTGSGSRQKFTKIPSAYENTLRNYQGM